MNKKQPNTKQAKRVLLVEDYPANVMVASIFLEEFGYAYDVAHDGHEALSKLKSGQYDIVLMDIKMHGMDGFEATRIIREEEQKKGSKRLHIIGMTAHAFAEDRNRCLAAGMDDYLSKPFNPTELRNKLALCTA